MVLILAKFRYVGAIVVMRRRSRKESFTKLYREV